MTFLRKIAILLSCLVLSQAVAYAQDPKEIVNLIRTHSSECRVVVEYVFSAEIDDVFVKDNGFVEAQDEMWHLKGEVYEIYTDTDATWILDLESREAIIEPAWTYDDLESFYSSLLAADAVFDIQIQPAVLTDRLPVSSFTPSLDKDWVITDLR